MHNKFNNLEDMQAQIIEPDKPRKKQGNFKRGTGKHQPKGVVPPGFAATVWKPGQSGNPGGRPAIYTEVLAMAREYAPQAIARLIELVASPDDRVALMAADKLLERAWGKPKEIQDDKDKPALDLSRLKATDLQALRGIAARLRGGDASPDGPVAAPEAPPSEVEAIPVEIDDE